MIMLNVAKYKIAKATNKEPNTLKNLIHDITKMKAPCYKQNVVWTRKGRGW